MIPILRRRRTTCYQLLEKEGDYRSKNTMRIVGFVFLTLEFCGCSSTPAGNEVTLDNRNAQLGYAEDLFSNWRLVKLVLTP